ncbi:MAG: hypothetical protein ABL931_09365 [Usitatibacteraceae bacterium]
MWKPFRNLMVIALAAGASACAPIGTGFYRPDLNDDIIGRVAIGQSEKEVIALLGNPNGRLRFDNLKSTSMDYRYRDTWGYWVDFSAMIGDDGLVVNKVSVRVDPVDSAK